MNRSPLLTSCALSLLTFACAEAPAISIGGEPVSAESASTAGLQTHSTKGDASRSVAAESEQVAQLDGELQGRIAEVTGLTPIRLEIPAGVAVGGEELAPAPSELEASVGAPERASAPVELQAGDVCTYSVAELATGCTSSKDPACLLQGDDFKAAYPEGLVIGVGAMTVTFSDMDALSAALPPVLDAAPLTESLVNPKAAEMDALSAELAALTINVDLSTEGLIGRYPLDALRITEGPFAGELVHTVQMVAGEVLAGDEASLERYTMDIEALTTTLAKINMAGAGCAGQSGLAL
jgi:hypothetical protein